MDDVFDKIDEISDMSPVTNNNESQIVNSIEDLRNEFKDPANALYLDLGNRQQYVNALCAVLRNLRENPPGIVEYDKLQKVKLTVLYALKDAFYLGPPFEEGQTFVDFLEEKWGDDYGIAETGTRPSVRYFVTFPTPHDREERNKLLDVNGPVGMNQDGGRRVRRSRRSRRSHRRSRRSHRKTRARK